MLHVGTFWDILPKEVFAISRYKPSFNDGLKASKELKLFT